jgi:hypothetical protein
MPEDATFTSTISGSKKYKEYRNGVMKGAVVMLGNYCLHSEDEQKRFIDSMSSSTDLIGLVHDNALVDYMDGLDGIPKLVMTVTGKILEQKCL